jgi:hypothetical protein
MMQSAGPHSSRDCMCAEGVGQVQDFTGPSLTILICLGYPLHWNAFLSEATPSCDRLAWGFFCYRWENIKEKFISCIEL